MIPIVTLADIKDRVFRMTSNLYTDTFHMRDLINMAITSLSNDARLERVVEYTVVQDANEYDLPAGFKSARALVEGTIDNPLASYNLVTIDELSFGYAIWDGKIVLKGVGGDKTLRFYYYAYATQLQENSDEVDPEFAGYADVVAAYAAAMILSLPGATEVTKYLQDRYFAVWDEGRARFKQDSAKRTKQATVRKVDMWG